MALHNYAMDHGTLPPAYTVDADGNRLHSWRTLILPYLEGTESLYELIDLTRTWDDPSNADVRDSTVDAYQCPSAFPSLQSKTTYLGVVGPENFFSGPTPRAFSEFTDGSHKTVAVIDVEVDRAVHWMSPHDDDAAESLLDFDSDASVQHRSVTLVLFVDGHVDGISPGSYRADREAMLTIAGGESVAE